MASQGVGKVDYAKMNMDADPLKGLKNSSDGPATRLMARQAVAQNMVKSFILKATQLSKQREKNS